MTAWNILIHVSGITLHDLFYYFEHEHLGDPGDEDDVSHVGLLDVEDVLDGGSEEDQAQLESMKNNDNVFKSTMFQLLRRPSVGDLNLQNIADERWSDLNKFERKVEGETIMEGRDGIVGDILPGNLLTP